jgi:hypothetical protein
MRAHVRMSTPVHARPCSKPPGASTFAALFALLPVSVCRRPAPTPFFLHPTYPTAISPPHPTACSPLRYVVRHALNHLKAAGPGCEALAREVAQNPQFSLRQRLSDVAANGMNCFYHHVISREESERLLSGQVGRVWALAPAIPGPVPGLCGTTPRSLRCVCVCCVCFMCVYLCVFP